MWGSGCCIQLCSSPLAGSLSEPRSHSRSQGHPGLASLNRPSVCQAAGTCAGHIISLPLGGAVRPWIPAFLQVFGLGPAPVCVSSVHGVPVGTCMCVVLCTGGHTHARSTECMCVRGVCVCVYVGVRLRTYACGVYECTHACGMYESTWIRTVCVSTHYSNVVCARMCTWGCGVPCCSPSRAAGEAPEPLTSGLVVVPSHGCAECVWVSSGMSGVGTA